MIYHIGRIKKKNSRARNRFIDAENKEVAGSGGEGVGGGIGEMSEIGEGYKRYKLPVIKQSPECNAAQGMCFCCVSHSVVSDSL